MNPQKILYVTTHYHLKNSSASVRNNALVRGLIELGHKVDVMTVAWAENRVSDFFVQEKNGRVFYSKLDLYNTLKKGESFLPSFLKRLGISNFFSNLVLFPDSFKEWHSKILNTKLDFVNYDLLISSSDSKSSHFAARKIKSKHPSLKWCQVWGDPWVDDIGLSKLHKPIVWFLEPKILSSADRIFYVSKLTLEKLQRKHQNLASKMSFCPRSYYREVLPENTANSNTIRLLYPGVLGVGRDIIQLAKACDQFNLNAKRRIELVVFTNETYRDQLKKFECVEFHAPTDYDGILKQFAKVQGVIFIENLGESGQIPGKLFDYFGTKLPVICLLNNLNGKLANILKGFKRCLIFENKKEAIALKIDQLLTIENLLFDYELEFSPKAVAESFIEKALK